VVNKVDLLADKAQLLPFIDAARGRFPFAEVIPVSALKEKNTAELEAVLIGHLPPNPWLFPEDQLTDRNSRYLASEFVREKIVRQMGDELPYEVAVEIEEFRIENGVNHVSALILVEKEGQKKML